MTRHITRDRVAIAAAVAAPLAAAAILLPWRGSWSNTNVALLLLVVVVVAVAAIGNRIAGALAAPLAKPFVQAGGQGTLGGRSRRSVSAAAGTDAWLRLCRARGQVVGAEMLSPYATWAYSRIRPPSRFRRRTRTFGPIAGGRSRPAGGLWQSVRCGR
jgi:hypothetical protein